jgi:hypothetical protein
MTPPPPHRCDERCVCPEHDLPLIYWPFGDEHACQVSSCSLFRDGSSPFQFILKPRVIRFPPRGAPPEGTAGA